MSKERERERERERISKVRPSKENKRYLVNLISFQRNLSSKTLFLLFAFTSDAINTFSAFAQQKSFLSLSLSLFMCNASLPSAEKLRRFLATFFP